MSNIKRNIVLKGEQAEVFWRTVNRNDETRIKRVSKMRDIYNTYLNTKPNKN